MKKSGAELGQQAQATAAAAGARAGAAVARGALRGMRQSPGGRGARGGPGAPAGARGLALRRPHPARPAPSAALGPRRTPEERGRRFPGGDGACPGRRLPKKDAPPQRLPTVGLASLGFLHGRPAGAKPERRSAGLQEGGEGKKKAFFPLAKQLNLGVGRSRQLKKKKSRHAIYFFPLYP